MGALFYFLIFLVSATLIYVGNRYAAKGLLWSRLAIVPGLLLPILLAGFRNGVGKDFFAYTSMVENLQLGGDLFYRSIEPLSSLIITISARFGDSATVVMFTLFSIPTVLFAYIAIKRMVPKGALYVALAYFLYICAIFPTTLNTVRSGVAVSLVMLGFSYLVKVDGSRRLLKFLLCAIAACMFHASAALMIPVGIVVFIAQSNRLGGAVNKLALLVSVAFAVAFPFVGRAIAGIPLDVISHYSKYLEQLGLHFTVPAYTALLVCIMVVSLIVTRKKAKKGTELRALHLVLMYYIPILLIIGWMSYYPAISRLGFFLDPIIIVVMMYAVQEIISKKGHMLTRKMITVLIMLGLGAVLMMRSLEWAQAIPYQSVFSEGQVYESEN